jgi:hypothetical protein
MECSSSVGTAGREARVGAHTGHRGCRGRGQCCKALGPTLTLDKAAQLFPSAAAKVCAPSLTFHLPGGQMAIPGGLVWVAAALDSQAHMGPADLGRHLVDKRRNPLIFIHPKGTG